MQITIVGDLTDEQRSKAIMLLRDAVYEFLQTRKGDYVERRYLGYSAAFKAAKKARTAEQVDLAENLLRELKW